MSEKIANQKTFTISQTTILNLKNDWQRHLNPYCSDHSMSEEMFWILFEKYSEKHRAYHNLSHINYLLESLKNYELMDFETVYLAAWFHDVIYEPKRNDNEIQSANLALNQLAKFNLPVDKIRKIERIILATQKHCSENLDNDGKLFLDLDLSILGADENTYRNYSQAIRQEYSHVPDILYSHGRRKVLESFLKLGEIYFTESLRERFENQARLNLANEIKELS